MWTCVCLYIYIYIYVSRNMYILLKCCLFLCLMSSKCVYAMRCLCAGLYNKLHWVIVFSVLGLIYSYTLITRSVCWLIYFYWIFIVIQIILYKHLYFKLFNILCIVKLFIFICMIINMNINICICIYMYIYMYSHYILGSA